MIVKVEDGGDVEIDVTRIHDGSLRIFMDIDTGEDSWVYLTVGEARKLRLALTRSIKRIELGE